MDFKNNITYTKNFFEKYYPSKNFFKEHESFILSKTEILDKNLHLIIKKDNNFIYLKDAFVKTVKDTLDKYNNSIQILKDKQRKDNRHYSAIRKKIYPLIKEQFKLDYTFFKDHLSFYEDDIKFIENETIDLLNKNSKTSSLYHSYDTIHNFVFEKYGNFKKVLDQMQTSKILFSHKSLILNKKNKKSSLFDDDFMLNYIFNNSNIKENFEYMIELPFEFKEQKTTITLSFYNDYDKDISDPSKLLETENFQSDIDFLDKLVFSEVDLDNFFDSIFQKIIKGKVLIDQDILLKEAIYENFLSKITKIKPERTPFLKYKINKNANEKDLIPKIKNAILKEIFDVNDRRINGFIKSVERKLIRNNIKIENFKDFFPEARNQNRTFHFLCGETNSGKTYTAFNEACKHKNGLYAAPLRLLALEGQQEFEKRGHFCSMVTGEEQDLKENANFISCTVEMIDYSKEYDVAIIDEVQLLNDSERGYAWLQAIIGLNAKEIYLVGSEDISMVVNDIIDYINKDHKFNFKINSKFDYNLDIEFNNQIFDISSFVNKKEIIYKKNFHRKTELIFDKEKYENVINKYGKLEPNSAVIAFSKSKVLSLKSTYEEMGNTVAVIYGSLPAAVRKIEMERFASGEAEVLIATDAIAMGLNLPIKNIYFDEIKKYNGFELQELNSQLVKQICGRAGRYNLFDIGYISATTDYAFDFVLGKFNEDSFIYEKDLKCAPNYQIMQQIEKLTEEKSIFKLLQTYNNAIVFDFDIKNHMNPLSYKIARHIDDILEKEYAMDHLTLKEKVRLVNSPISKDRKYELFDFFKECIDTVCLLKTDVYPYHILMDKIYSLKDDNQKEIEMSIKKLDILSWLNFNFEEYESITQEIIDMKHEFHNKLIKKLRNKK